MIKIYDSEGNSPMELRNIVTLLINNYSKLFLLANCYPHRFSIIVLETLWRKTTYALIGAIVFGSGNNDDDVNDDFLHHGHHGYYRK